MRGMATKGLPGGHQTSTICRLLLKRVYEGRLDKAGGGSHPDYRGGSLRYANTVAA